VGIAGQPVVMELEAIEPSLYFRMDPDAPGNFADAVLGWLGRARAPRPSSR
jgi:hypothetical protein